MIPLGLLEVGAKILERVIPDRDAREKAQAELLKASAEQDFQLVMQQLEINKIEAASPSLFKSGWRPAVGWICVLGLAYNFLIYPLLGWLAAIFTPTITPPPLISDFLMELVLALLGLGALRTFEKFKGVSK